VKRDKSTAAEEAITVIEDGDVSAGHCGLMPKI
jgi:hypothetical protein